MSFNPATFQIDATDNTVSKTVADARQQNEARDAKVAALKAAAARFAPRRDNFALGKAATCLDLAAKLERFGSFVSEKQAEFADKLIAWSLPREQAPVAQAPAAAPAPAAVVLPKLFALMQRLSKLTIGKLQVARKNQDSLCWVKLEGRDGVVGKIEAGKLVLFASRMSPAQNAEVLADLLRIEADPEAAAALHGKLSGRCSVCSRDLTDPVSIERGIGPICLEKF